MRDRLVHRLAFAILLSSASATAQDLAEIQACVRANVPRDAVRELVELRSRGRGGDERTVVARHWWKRRQTARSKHVIEARHPADVRGSTFLILEEDARQEVFSYLPELRKVRRLQARSISGPLLGTDFSYEDFRQLQDAMRDPRGERLADAALEERPVFVLRLEPAPESQYERILAYIDRETCVPLELRFYRKGEDLWKQITTHTESIRQIGSSWVAHSLVIRDLADETETQLEIREIELDVELPDRRFTVSSLQRGH